LALVDQLQARQVDSFVGANLERFQAASLLRHLRHKLERIRSKMVRLRVRFQSPISHCAGAFLRTIFKAR
jgi:hypothetical protein